MYQDSEIVKKVRIVEWLKTELVGNTAALFKAILKGGEDVVLDALAGVIIASMLLGKRLGMDFAQIDAEVEKKLAAHIKNGHEVEKWFGDLSAYLDYLRTKKR